MKHAVYGIVQTSTDAEVLVLRLKEAGFTRDDISVLFPDKQGTKDFAHEKNTKAPEGAAAGGLAGMGVGATVGWLAGIGTLAIPGVGPLIAAGPIMAALSGAAVGGATGGLIGGLVGMGMPEYEAKLYDGKIKGGNALVSIHAENGDEKDRAEKILKACGAQDVSSSTEEKV